ncbi:hypothetical protein [Spirosoma montaniterrae]|uniref:Amidohydrolase n=1 Tax=Spirosoma montaniterrae TaxID=1178516 RepID=A0A1P9WX34_9BACT|nr:hypothetical protein AWR27_11710 [Spirosoma montaniterrae]
MTKQILLFALLLPNLLLAQKAKKAATPAPDKDKQTAIASLDSRFSDYAGISKQIWDFAELGYMEEKSSALLQEQLRKEGFTVSAGVAGIPTAFVATLSVKIPICFIINVW